MSDKQRGGPPSETALPEIERRLHRALIESMISSGDVPPAPTLGSELGVSLDVLRAHLRKLADADYLGFDPAGRLTCVYPFSAVPTPHVVVLGDARRFAMCSIDALGMSAMLGRPVTIEGSCAVCGVEIRVEVESGWIQCAGPSETVVIARSSGDEPACEVCCPQTLFACSPAHAQTFVAQMPETSAVSLMDALHHAETIFGDFLGESLPARRRRSVLTTASLQT